MTTKTKKPIKMKPKQKTATPIKKMQKTATPITAKPMGELRRGQGVSKAATKTVKPSLAPKTAVKKKEYAKLK